MQHRIELVIQRDISAKPFVVMRAAGNEHQSGNRDRKYPFQHVSFDLKRYGALRKTLRQAETLNPAK
jgi:recombinational DNA repair protein (RecF pathway)